MKREKGFSMLQLMLVMVFSIVLISIAMTFYRDSRDTADFKDLSYNLSSIFLGVSNMFARGETDTLNTQMAMTAGLIPSAMNYSNGVLYNVFGGEVKIYGSKNTNAINNMIGVRAFEVQYLNVPKVLCARLINNQMEIGWHGFGVSSGSEAPIAANTKYKSETGMLGDFNSGNEYVLASQIIEACSVNGSDVNITLVFDNDI